MMNKLTALFAMVIGLSLVADVDAAGRRNPRRGAAKPAVVEAPKADEAEAPKADDKKADKAEAPKADDKKVDEAGFFARRRQNLIDAKDWAKENPYKTAGITVGTVATIVIAAEAVKNGKNSWLPRAYRAMTGKNQQHNRLADVIKAKEAAAKAA